MGRNYSNIDLANKMQHISREGYLLHVLTITIHHLPKEHKLHQERKKKKIEPNAKRHPIQDHGLSVQIC